ncbi:cytochrome P450 [Actinomadura sp. WMMB 499]|uniref:cytochrome P450 n=1 Tax=Actinomadura sp. WMMB 499 TaxID=1219491 RepID=UPI001246C1D0|nr:cytochrome P450 [Actinomadura sp. WMMB 499]QFG20510.1 cytochrome P450 [Actinomadura sp. WMMB 499]
MQQSEQTVSEGYLRRYEEAVRRDPAAAPALIAGWLRTDWRPLFAELRARRPVLSAPGLALVTRSADVREVLSRWEVFTVAAYTDRLEGALGGPVMLSRDATPLHWRERGLLQVMLPPEDVPAVRELAGRAADAALDAAAPHGRIEAVGGLFRHVALRVCAEYFGFPGPDEATLSRWSREVITDVTANLPGDPDVRAASARAGSEMMDHLREVLAARRAAPPGGPPAAPPGDVFDRLLRTTLPARAGVDDERVLINVAALMLGFVENASGSLVHLVGELLSRPDAHARAAEAARDPDPARVDGHVWEALRFDPFLKVIARVSARDHLLAAGTPHATTVPAGTLVLAAAASAMFDADAVADPLDYRPGRPADVYLHFGYGPHSCVGVHPGAAVICEVVRRLLRRPGVRLLPPPDGGVVRDRGVFPDRFVLGLGPSGEGSA